ncbi:MAG: proline--tRNA ligase [Candidatus Lernaella stagnicola]|nr:proline--tRNA ligase [Candidatus Lernaella stagnicola]
MRLSQMYVPTLKETPADAEVVSHQLMLRAGMIRKLAAGIYDYLPLGLRVIRKVEQIVREEMDRAGALEVLLPYVHPAELWRESGRWELYGPELARLKDRSGREFCLAPTAEEVITDLVRHDLRSYKDMPLNLYQISPKFRDEVRPRFGLMRGREFIMKDAYSFDADEEGANAAYERMREAYNRIFRRCGLRFREVAADSGNIGGSFSAEFMVLADTGEDAIVYSDEGHYAANVEKAELPEVPDTPFDGEPAPLEKVHTPDQRTIEEVSAFLETTPQQMVKTLIFLADGEPVVALVRGDHEINMVKLQRLLGAEMLELADPDTIQQVTGAPVGFAGPQGLKVKHLIADYGLRGLGNLTSGANEADYHVTGLNVGRDFEPTQWADIRVAEEGDPCPHGGTYKVVRGIEVGHVFKLGQKYSESMRCTFLDENGKAQQAVMGCYGIGIGRTAASAIEQGHDDRGIIWPIPLAPYHVVIVPAGKPGGAEEVKAQEIYEQLRGLGVEVVFDDRKERPGVKFADADLVGYPIRITVGKRSLAENAAELKLRAEADVTLVPLEEVSARVQQIITEALRDDA